MTHNNRGNILVVDDDQSILQTISILLKKHGYRPVVSNSAEDAITRLKENSYDAVMADIKMPDMSGLQLLDMIRNFNSEIPVIMMTAFADFYAAVDAIKLKAFDFIIKPYENKHILHSVEKAVHYYRLIISEKDYKLKLEESVEEKTRELALTIEALQNASREMMQRLAMISEFRDTDTGPHIRRIGMYSQKISEALNMSKDFINTISFASTLHDIGKVGIPDSVLLKPGSLTSEEFETIMTHTTIGMKMLSGSTYPGIQMAASIAMTHHEKWNGKGYPQGLSGEQIPIEGRIVFLADRYDAIRSKRPYKPPIDHQRALRIMKEGQGKSNPEHYDPMVLDAFIKVSPTFEKIFNLI